MIAGLLLLQQLVFGSNPQNLNFDIAKMRPHLETCLRAGQMSQFLLFFTRTLAFSEYNLAALKFYLAIKTTMTL